MSSDVLECSVLRCMCYVKILNMYTLKVYAKIVRY